MTSIGFSNWINLVHNENSCFQKRLKRKSSSVCTTSKDNRITGVRILNNLKFFLCHITRNSSSSYTWAVTGSEKLVEVDKNMAIIKTTSCHLKNAYTSILKIIYVVYKEPIQYVTVVVNCHLYYLCNYFYIYIILY